jgi:hypothetical protein
LNEDAGNVAGRQRFVESAQVDAAVVTQRELAVAYAFIHQRVRGVADGVAQRVVRRTGNRKQRPAGRRAGRQSGNDCVRSADDRRAREDALGSEHASQQRLVARAGRIVVAVTGRTGEVAFGDALVEERPQHVDLHALLRSVCERRRPRLRGEGRRANSAFDTEPPAQLGDQDCSKIWRSYARTNG